MILPNCITESKLMGTTSLSNRAKVQSYAMRFFDGQEWHEVTLPERWVNTSDTAYFQVIAATSDRILLFRQAAPTSQRTRKYPIMLESDIYTLEHTGTLEYAELSGR